jgi:sulfur-oxidizing protein SoxY
MNRRRDLVKLLAMTPLAVTFGGLVALVSKVAVAAAGWSETLFAVRSVSDAEQAFAGRAGTPSDEVVLTAPDIAENGAVVPITVATSLKNVAEIAILVERNPNTVAATFQFPTGTDPSVTTRVKLGQTSDVVALVKTDIGLFTARKNVKVTLGGCGG